MSEKEKLMSYIRNNFNVDRTTMLLIDSIYDYLYNNVYNLTIITYNDNRIAIHSFLYDLLNILNDSGIDLSMNELLDNNAIEMECR